MKFSPKAEQGSVLAVFDHMSGHRHGAGQLSGVYLSQIQPDRALDGLECGHPVLEAVEEV
jgi:hypothetical protein